MFLLFTLPLLLTYQSSIAQEQGSRVNDPPAARQKTGIVISSCDAETVWNAFRLANFALNQGDSVSVFLLGKGVEAPGISDRNFDIADQISTFSSDGGKIMSSGTCLKLHKLKAAKICPVASLSDLYILIRTHDKLLTF